MRSRDRILLCLAVAVTAASVVSAAGAVWSQAVMGGPEAISTATLAAPTALTVRKSACVRNSYFTLSFSWQASNPTTGITGYEIAYATATAGPWTDVYATPNGTGTITWVSPYPPGRTDWQAIGYYSVRATRGAWSSTATVSARYTAPRANNCNGG